MSTFLIAQLVGCVALVLSLSIFQLNKRKAMLRLGVVSALIYSVHFFLLGAYTGAAMNVINGARGYAFYKVEPDKRHVGILILFIAIAGVATYITWQSIISLLPLIAATIGGIALWHKKPRAIRRWALLAPPVWFIYSYLVGSYPGMIVETIMFTSNLVGEYRFDIDHRKHMRRKLAKPV